MADNTTSRKLLAEGTVKVAEQAASGSIVLEDSPCTILIGIEFLRALSKTLIVSDTDVWLVDRADAARILGGVRA